MTVYEQQLLIHQQYLVAPNDPNLQTENVEDTWTRNKRKWRKQFVFSENLFPSYLYELVWRNNFRENILGNFMLCIAIDNKL